MMMFLMRLPLQTRYTILSEGCSCPTMPNDDEGEFLFDSSRHVRVDTVAEDSAELTFLLWPVAEDGASASACSLSPVAADFFSWLVAIA